MDASTLIDILKNSKNKLLVSASKDIMDWSKLEHNKRCLELFLTYNMAVVNLESKGEFLVSSHPGYLNFLNRNRVVKNKNRVVNIIKSSPTLKSSMFRSKNQGIVRTWDLIRNNKLEIPMDMLWTIEKWIGINSDNVEPLSIATAEILTKGKFAK